MTTLSIDQLKPGQKAALTNAAALIEEARLLHEHKRWPRVLFLCQIAGEELGKYVIMGGSILELACTGQLNWKSFCKRYINHKCKLKTITYAEDIFLDQPCPENYEDMVKEMASDLEKGKQKALYSDFTDNLFHTPHQVITEQLATNALKWAEGRLKYITFMDKITSTPLSEDVLKEKIRKFEQLLGVEIFQRPEKSQDSQLAEPDK